MKKKGVIRKAEGYGDGSLVKSAGHRSTRIEHHADSEAREAREAG